MFARGFSKIAGTATIVPKKLQDMTGAKAQEIFGSPVKEFAKAGRRMLVPVSKHTVGIK